MTTWRPASRSYVEDQLTSQLRELARHEREAFEAIGVPFRQVRVADDRGQSVYVVAEHDGQVVYWEDVEEGWNVSKLDWAGQIPSRGSEQDDLKALMYRLQLVRLGDEK